MHAVSELNKALRHERELKAELLDSLISALALIEALMPGVRHIPIQDFAALNSTPLKARAAIAKATGGAQ